VLSQRSRAIWPVPYLFTCLVTCVPGAESPAPTRDFAVDTSDRSEVVALYHAIYMASEGYQNRIQWTGNYSSTAAGAEGTISQVFSDDVERRLNYYRAMCGLGSGTRVNSGAVVRIDPEDAHQPAPATTKSAASQRSALMIARTYPSIGGLSHNPAQSCIGWTTAAWNANKNGNLSLGYFGPGAVDAYAKEDVMGTSAWNLDAGHRRWLLLQGATDFATGDTPGHFNPGTSSARPPTNAMYVVPRQGERETVAPVFVSYPPKGYFPAKLNTPFWSLSYPDADFSAATVTMTGAGGAPVSVSIVSRRTGYGDNTLIWQVPAATAAKEVATDTTWNVTVSNIQGAGVPSQRSWSVILIDPERLNETPQISGASNPLVTGGIYTVTPVAGAEEMQAGMALRKPATWTEGAEDGTVAQIIDRTSGTYAFRATNAGYVKTGVKSFRLTFPTRYDPFINGVPEQIMELDRELIPGPAGTLNFQYRRGLMSAASKLAVETSADGGLTWSLAGSLFSGLGGAGDASFQTASLPLPEGPLRVRFRFYLSDPTSPLYAHEDYPNHATGVFIDDISTSGSTWLEPSATLASAGMTSFAFNSTTAGTTLAAGQEWWLRARAVLGGKAFPWGPAKVVIPSGPLMLSGPAEPPLSGADYFFVPDPGATSYHLEVSRLGPSDWLEGAEIAPAPQVQTDISGTYALSSNLKGFRKSGAFAFRLGLSSLTDEVESFTIDRQIVPGAGSVLEFWTRRGGMSPTNALHVEISTDGGATWSSAWSLPGLKKAEKKVLRRSVALGEWADQPIRVRFAVRKAAGGTNLKWNAKSSGVWIDDIMVTDSTTLISTHETAVAGLAVTVRLDATTAGAPLEDGATMRLRMRTVTGATVGSWGPALTVSPSASASEPVLPQGFSQWAEVNHPAAGLSFEGDSDADGLADGIEYAFSLDPTGAQASPDLMAADAERISLSRTLPEERAGVHYGAEWSDDLATWSEDGVQIEIADGTITASVPKGSGERFMRWRIEEE
jgi:hypothetical protein